jgi:proton-translocating NADH-quinone oxidoreductase chain N
MVNPVLLIIIPLTGAFAIPLFGFISKYISKYISLISTLVMTVIVSSLIPKVIDNPIIVMIGGFKPPFGINLVVSPLSLFFVGVISLLGFLVSIYAIKYIDDGDIDKYHLLFLLFITGATGVVLTGDIFNLFVFFEILCISSYALVAYNRDKDGVEAGIKYLIQGSVGSAFILIGIALLYGLCGSLNMADIASQIHFVNSPLLSLSLFLFITGFGIEAAIFPLNGWLPDAHSSAPSTISAVLSGFAIEIGLYAVMRIVCTVFGATDILHFLAGLGIFTLLIGELSAFKQNDIKRLLAYSSIGQIGLILFAFSLGTPEGIAGGLFHILSHALSKGLLFLAAGYMIYKAGSREIGKMKGLGTRMPVTSFCFLIATFSLVGLPPFIGFPSKFIIIKSALSTNQGYFFVLVGAALLGTVIEISYFFKLLQNIFSKTGEDKVDEAPLSALIPIIIMALIILAVGVYPEIVSRFLHLASANFMDRMGYINNILGAL